VHVALLLLLLVLPLLLQLLRGMRGNRLLEQHACRSAGILEARLKGVHMGMGRKGV
tara:strand:- start:107 stop:274 length:168 start_codon:yes stop_codon:yes gene_type:complete